MNPNEVWQVEVNGEIYETNIEGLVEWIAEGSLLPGDKVKRGKLRWLEAGKIPALYGFFNAKELGLEMPKIQFTTTDGGASSTENPASAPTVSTENFAPPQSYNPAAQQNDFGQTNFHAFNDSGFGAPPVNQNVCIIHPDTEPKFICDTCANVFCKDCPKSYGGTVKICPMCGAMCKPLADVQAKIQQQFQFQHDMGEGFGFADFGRAFAYPFKFKTSLFFGAIFFMFFTLGQSAGALGNIFLAGAAIFCLMMANSLTFGVMANTVENFMQGRIGVNFMPNFDDFSLWDDVIHPFFLSIAVYLVSFGMMLVLIIAALLYLWNSVTNLSGPSNQPSTMISMPDGSTVRTNGVMTEQEMRDLSIKLDQNAKMRNAQQQSFETGNSQSGLPTVDQSEAEILELNEMINQQRKEQAEAMLGKNPAEAEQMQQQALMTLLKTAGIFVIPIILAFLWGLFYLPAGCAVAGYTRSFFATLNPLVGIDTIKRLGADYFKILGMGLVLLIVSLIISFILHLVLMPFNLPRLGNLPATAIGSLFMFYFSVVFSCILGFALYKNSHRFLKG